MGVSSEISIDFHSRIPDSTEQLSCSATLDHRSGGWGHSSGRVTTGNGELMATVRQRMRYFPAVPAVFNGPDEQSHAPSWLPSLDSLLTLTSQRSNMTDLELEALPGMLNSLGILHGGVGLCLSELAAPIAWAGPSRRALPHLIDPHFLPAPRARGRRPAPSRRDPSLLTFGGTGRRPDVQLRRSGRHSGPLHAAPVRLRRLIRGRTDGGLPQPTCRRPIPRRFSSTTK